MRHRPAVEAGAHGKASTHAGGRLHQPDQLVDPRRLYQRLFVAAVIALVGDLDEDVAIALSQQPVGRIRHRAPDRRLVVEPLVLAEIEVADDGDHAELVGAIEDRSSRRR